MISFICLSTYLSHPPPPMVQLTPCCSFTKPILALNSGGANTPRASISKHLFISSFTATFWSHAVPLHQVTKRHHLMGDPALLQNIVV